MSAWTSTNCKALPLTALRIPFTIDHACREPRGCCARRERAMHGWRLVTGKRYNKARTCDQYEYVSTRMLLTYNKLDDKN